MGKGLFISFEGPDGCGKSTQVQLLEKYFQDNNIPCLVTREPGGTRVGESIREIILTPIFDEMSDTTEMLLYAASRAQLMKDVIIPALEKGMMVISDRFVDSSLVYQGIARGLGIDTVHQVNQIVVGDYNPDKVFFIDISEEEGLRRKKEQKKLDRLEQESVDFHRMVSEGYRKVLSDRKDVITFDGTKSIEEVHEEILQEIKKLLETE